MAELVTLIIISIIIYAVLVRAAANGKSDGSNRENNFSHIRHKKKSHLATENERKLYYALLNILPENYVVHSQVSLLALVEPVERKHISRVWAKRMDYVITDGSTKVLAVIELDDATYNWESRRKSDEYKNHALAGHHELLRINTQKYYKQSDIKALLEAETGIVCR